MSPTWVILTPLAAIGLAVVALRLRKRRADRAWAAGVASRVHDGAYLRWLEEQFAATDAEGRQ